jgi:hypothetical protein
MPGAHSGFIKSFRLIRRKGPRMGCRQGVSGQRQASLELFELRAR